MPKFALSIKQPWAWMICNGYKAVENRTWPSNFRGEFFIHTGKKVDEKGYIHACQVIKFYGLQFKLPEISELQTGGIVGQAKVVDCIDKFDSIWFTGPFGFVLKDAKPLPFKAMPGMLGFFKVNQKQECENKSDSFCICEFCMRNTCEIKGGYEKACPVDRNEPLPV